jgi:hypothetical protein
MNLLLVRGIMSTDVETTRAAAYIPHFGVTRTIVEYLTSSRFVEKWQRREPKRTLHVPRR